MLPPAVGGELSPFDIRATDETGQHRDLTCLQHFQYTTTKA